MQMQLRCSRAEGRRLLSIKCRITEMEYKRQILAKPTRCCGVSCGLYEEIHYQTESDEDGRWVAMNEWRLDGPNRKGETNS